MKNQFYDFLSGLITEPEWSFLSRWQKNKKNTIDVGAISIDVGLVQL